MKIPPQWCRDIARMIGLSFRGLLCRDPAQRRLLRFRLATLFAQRVGGFRVLHYGTTWDKDPEFLSLWPAYPDAEKRPSPSHYALFSLVRSISHLPGDTAECGVFIGTSSYWICAASERMGHLHHAFDSFQGLPSPTAEDRPGARKAFDEFIADKPERVVIHLPTGQGYIAVHNT